MVDKITLRHRIFNIVETLQGTDDWGSIDYRNREIYIDPALTEEYDKQLTLLHECVHLMLNELGRPDIQEDDIIADGLANVLYDLIRQNPELVKYITK